MTQHPLFPFLSSRNIGIWNLGIGTELMKQILLTLKEREYKQVSLSVQKINYAVSMYKKVGFEVVRKNEEDYVMFCKL